MGNRCELCDVQRSSMTDKVAVLSSGGLDSAVLIADYARKFQVFPVYVQAGLSWEAVELKALRTFVKAIRSPNVRPITVLQSPVAPLYGDHWSVTGKDVPQASEPDRTVYMPGRNILLICPTAVWCSINGVHRIATGSLNENPFADATPEFFRSLGKTLSEGLEHDISVESPYSGLSKAELIAENKGLPLHLTLTCIAPVDGRHCGRCSKCHERRLAFARAGVNDQTPYAAAEE